MALGNRLDTVTENVVYSKSGTRLKTICLNHNVNGFTVMFSSTFSQEMAGPRSAIGRAPDS